MMLKTMKKLQRSFVKRSLLGALLLGMSALSPLSAFSQVEGNQIDFTVGGIDPTPDSPPYGKGPVAMPNVWQNGYLLDFNGSHPDYLLLIVDATNTPVYVTAVPSSQTQVWLPTTLIGTFRIELIMDSWLFYGYINL